MDIIRPANAGRKCTVSDSVDALIKRGIIIGGNRPNPKKRKKKHV